MPRSSESYPVLLAQSGPLNGERWVIHGPITIGRGEECDIVIPDRKISRQHAQVRPASAGIVLEDLGSKNGTHHNGTLIKGIVSLSDGDIIQIALAQKFAYVSSDATMPLEFEPPIESGLEPRRLRMDKRSRRVWVKEQEVVPPLSVAQFTMLDLLYQRDGLVVPREEMVQAVWGQEQAYGISDQALDALVRRLRDRLAEVDKGHDYVVTVRGHGLRLENPKAERK